MIKTEFIYQDNNIKYDEIVESNFPFSIEANIFEIERTEYLRSLLLD